MLAPNSYPFTEQLDVRFFHQKFGVPMATEPSFLNPEALEFRIKFLKEELQEFIDAHAAYDMHGAADALVDLAYVLHGTALMMGLPWPALWNEVQRANMAKVRATNASQSKRGSALDVIKPEGWKAPDHIVALGAGPWPMLQHTSEPAPQDLFADELADAKATKPLKVFGISWHCAGDEAVSFKVVEAESSTAAIIALLTELGDDAELMYVKASVHTEAD